MPAGNEQQEFDDLSSSEVDNVNLNFNTNRRLNVDPPRDVVNCATNCFQGIILHEICFVSG